MRIFITGGAGFIGSHLTKFLVGKGIDVCVFDSLVSGSKERIPIEASFIQGDIRDRGVLVSAMKNMTHVVHLAALVSVVESMHDPIAVNEVNVLGTENVLHTMYRTGITRIVYATSAAVYGNGPSLPKLESSSLLPQSPYALSKVLNELQAGMYERAFGLSTIGLRFFNVYGPGQMGDHPYASVIPRWIEAVRKGESITIYGDGSQTRDFVHVHDVVNAIYKSLITDATGVFNVASGEETSLMSLLGIITDVCGVPIEVKKEPSRSNDISRSVADISRIRRTLQFEPSLSLSEGISELLKL